MFKTLKSKITSVYMLLVLMIVIVGTVSVFNLLKLSRVIDGLMIDNYKSIDALNHMLEAIERQDSAILTYLYVDMSRGMELFEDRSKVFTDWYNIELNNITELGEKSLVSEISQEYESYNSSFAEIQVLFNSDGIEKATEHYKSITSIHFDDIKSKIRQLIDINKRAMFKSKDHVSESIYDYAYMIFTISLVTAVGGLTIALYSTSRFLKPIYSLTQTIKSVKAGDLNQHTRIVSKDEIGELAVEFNNMTARLRQFEESTIGELMTERNKSMTIVKNISEPLIVLDKNHKIVLINTVSESFFNIDESTAVGKSLQEVIRNNEIYEIMLSVQQAEGLERNSRIVCFKKDEKDFYFNIVVTAIKDSDKSINEFLLLFQNVTQLKELEKIKADFVATVSHEFKTPLTSIMMGASLMLDEGVGRLNERQRKLVSAISEDTENLSVLVNNLLHLSKIESGRAIFNIQHFNINSAINDTVKLFEELASSKGININYYNNDKLPLVKADKEKIAWVLNNLISNAVKYIPSIGTIKIDAYIKYDKMCVSVSDTGIGISEEYLEKIFDKFVRIEYEGAESNGTGLGLAIAKELVEANGGEIWCESTLNKGSTFIFTLPL